jgi:hypothetical protein
VLNLMILPHTCRSDAEVASLRGKFANQAHYEYLIDEGAYVLGPEGVIARLVTNCLSESLVANTARFLGQVKGDASGRGSVVGKGAMMPRFRADGSLSNTMAVPPPVIAKMRARGTYSDFLGWMDKSKMGDRFSECRQTGWSTKRPDIHAASYTFIQEVSRVYREELPDHWLRQNEFMDRVSPDWKFLGSEYSTVTVNKNLRTPYHYDAGDFAGGMGNLVVLVGEDAPLVMPRYRVAFLPRPTDVLLMNVHELHGNLPFEGERLTAVLYAREHIDDCGVPDH